MLNDGLVLYEQDLKKPDSKATGDKEGEASTPCTPPQLIIDGVKSSQRSFSEAVALGLATEKSPQVIFCFCYCSYFFFVGSL